MKALLLTVTTTGFLIENQGYETGTAAVGDVVAGDTPFCGAVVFEEGGGFRLRLNGTAAPAPEATTTSTARGTDFFRGYLASDWVVLQRAIEDWALGVERDLLFLPWRAAGSPKQG